MGDIGDIWKINKKVMQKKRQLNRSYSADLLRKNNIDFESKNAGAHLIMRCNMDHIICCNKCEFFGVSTKIHIKYWCAELCTFKIEYVNNPIKGHIMKEPSYARDINKNNNCCNFMPNKMMKCLNILKLAVKKFHLLLDKRKTLCYQSSCQLVMFNF